MLLNIGNKALHGVKFCLVKQSYSSQAVLLYFFTSTSVAIGMNRRQPVLPGDELLFCIGTCLVYAHNHRPRTAKVAHP